MISFLIELLWLFLYVVKCVVVYRIGRFVVSVLTAVYVYYIAPTCGIGVDFKRYQQTWTVITGCTDGIGEAYIFALAEKGLKKFILISRNLEKLKVTSNRLLDAYCDCQVESFAFTFGRDDYETLKNFLRKFEIGILVNNVGDAPSMLQRFGDDYEVDKRVTAVNIEPAFELIQTVLPRMKQFKEGIIVNISSSQSIRPVPFLATYSASKVYISYLSECLRREYARDGIIVQCLAPLLVATKLVYYKNNISGVAAYFVVPPEKFARQAVSSLGVVSFTMGCFNHEIQIGKPPSQIIQKTTGFNLRSDKMYRKSFLYLLPWWILRHLVAPLYQLQQARLLAVRQKEQKFP